MKFGTWIRAHRLRQNLSMDRVCQDVDLSKAYLSLIETGQKPPPKDEIIRQLAGALSLEERDLLMRAHRERYPEDVVEMRRILEQLQETVSKLSEAALAVSSDDIGLPPAKQPPKGMSIGGMPVMSGGAGLPEGGGGSPAMTIERGAAAVRQAVQKLERLMPNDVDLSDSLSEEVNSLRAEEREFLLTMAQKIKALRPRRGPQNNQAVELPDAT